jgi:nucleoside 2-deoxyribosyltransferase
MTTLYIAGPMAGYPEANFPAFFAARKQLELAGFTVLCPTDNEDSNPSPGTPQSFDWYLRRDLAMVVQSDGLALLPGFEGSRGAHLELDVAHALGILTLPVHMWIPEGSDVPG